ncbi:integrase/recombinase xerD homolog [Montipora foliosa]|uniref:integrase/recombinase xerD homolog n=1 Tax=Montipora foliosa TaxID=591990 RepID=UPI0035F1BA3A
MVLVHAALKWFHSFVPDDGPNPLDNAYCKNFIECAKRTRGNPVNKKKPVDPTIIRSIIDRHGTEEASLKDLRIAAISFLGFAGFLRFNELSNIQPKHLTFCGGFVKLFVPRSKTDVYREGNYVYIAKLEGKYLPT